MGPASPRDDEGEKCSRRDPPVRNEDELVKKPGSTVKECHVQESHLDLVELIRSIQRAEGNRDCFLREDSCDEMECAWRPYCHKNP